MRDLTAYDQVVVNNGDVAPGLANLMIHNGLAYKWDARGGKTAGQVGANLSYGGRELAQWSVVFELFPEETNGVLETNEQVIERWTQWIQKYRYADQRIKGKDVKALHMYHPKLAAMGLRQCVITQEGDLQLEKQTGAIVVQVDFLEFRAVKEAKAKAASTEITPQEQPKKDPITEANDAEIARLRRELEAAQRGTQVSGQRGLTPSPSAKEALDSAAAN